MDQLKVKRLKGATLIEIVVALIVMMIILGIAMMIYINVLNSSYSSNQLKGYLVLKKTALETVTLKKYYDEKFEQDEITVIKSLTPYPDNSSLMLLHLEAVDANDKTISTFNQLVRLEND